MPSSRPLPGLGVSTRPAGAAICCDDDEGGTPCPRADVVMGDQPDLSGYHAALAKEAAQIAEGRALLQLAPSERSAAMAGDDQQMSLWGVR